MNCMGFDRARRRSLGVLSALALGLSVFAGSAPALVIDNFEQGTFNFVAPAGAEDGGTQTSLLSFNCISSVREVRVRSFDATQPAGATLSLSNVDDEVATVMPDGGGNVSFGYDIGVPTDITLGGSLNRIRVWLPVAPIAAGAGEVVVRLRDASSTEETVSVTFSGPGDVDILFSDFSVVDLQNIERIDVTLVAFGVGDYHVRDIRAIEVGPSTIVWSPSDGTTVSGPTYPIVLWWMGSAEDEGGAMMPAGDASLTLVDAQLPGACDPFCDGVPFSMMTGMPGDPERLVETELWWNGVPAGPLPDETLLTFDWMLDFPPSFHYGEPILAVETGPKGFMVDMLVDWMDPVTEETVATSFHRLTGEIAGSQALLITETQPVALPGQEPHISVQLCIANDGGARGAGSEVALDAPLFVVRFDGTVAPEPGVVSVPGATPATLLLSAVPSIMRSQTTFDLGTASAERRVVEVYNIGGRRVRALTVPAGRHEVRWDGRNEAGVRAAAGVYFARMSNAPSPVATRLVLLP